MADEVDDAQVYLDKAWQDFEKRFATRTTEPQLMVGEKVVCRDCGDTLSEARLAAVPTASRCATCQNIKERMHVR